MHVSSDQKQNRQKMQFLHDEKVQKSDLNHLLRSRKNAISTAAESVMMPGTQLSERKKLTSTAGINAMASR